MKEHKLSVLIKSVNPDAAFLAELQERLSNELKKSVDELDYDRIDEMTEAIAVLTGKDEVINERVSAGIERTLAVLHRKEKQRKISRICRAAAIACAIVLIATNVWSYSAYGMNAFSAAYQFLNGGITVDLTVPTDEGKEAGNKYAQDMQDKCAEHHISAQIPRYIPAGFAPTENYGKLIETDLYKDLLFYFGKGNAKLFLQVREFADQSTITPIGIPTDTHNISEQVIDGTTIHIVKEDQEYRAVFLIDRTQYALGADHLDYDECQRVLESLF